MSIVNMRSITRHGYVSDTSGFTGVFSWFRHPIQLGKWFVTCHETRFISNGYWIAVTDDFGNLVKVQS